MDEFLDDVIDFILEWILRPFLILAVCSAIGVFAWAIIDGFCGVMFG